MPKLELGDLEAVARLKEANIPQLLERGAMPAATSSRRSPPAC